YYNVNEHLNPTNVCVYRCSFCSFRADLKSPTAYVMSEEQIVARAREATEKGCTELHIVGGLHHQMPYDWYLGIIRTIHREFPDLHLKAWTAVEWDWMGGRSNATMLYGHIEKAEHRIDHLIRLRELQDVTGGFQTFIPLAFHPDNNPLGQGIAKPSGLTDLKMMAIARLMLDNFPHVKAYWQMLGVKVAQVAQSWGA